MEGACSTCSFVSSIVLCHILIMFRLPIRSSLIQIQFLEISPFFRKANELASLLSILEGVSLNNATDDKRL